LTGASFVLVVASAGVALGVARALTGVIHTRVPDALTDATPNAIDLDPRAIAFTLVAAAATWGLSTIPVVLLARRTDVLDALRADGGLTSARRSGLKFRRTLAASAIALSTALLIGAVLADRTYSSLLSVDRGYDTRNLATLELRVPNATYPSFLARQFLADRILEELRRRPEVVAASQVEGMFPSFAGSSSGRVFTDAGEKGTATWYTYSGDPTFLKTIGLPLLGGRLPLAGEPNTHVVVSEPFARRFAMAGVYGVMAFLVAGRRREIGIRMALGADAAQVGVMVLGSSLRLVVTGALAGLGLALAASRWTESRLFGVSATDPFVFSTVALVVVLSAIVATWPPARSAARVDPVRTLRTD
jgi:FtsX-like permease family